MFHPRYLAKHRVVRGLEWARISAKVPWNPRPQTPAQRRGMTFQRKATRQLTQLLKLHAPSLKLFPAAWVEFSDAEGRGFAQPDFFAVGAGHVWLFEFKLTQTPVAFLQMEELYTPLLEAIYGLPVVQVQVCKNLTETPERRVSNIQQVLGATAPLRATWLML